jgi:hypothetical protein
MIIPSSTQTSDSWTYQASGSTPAGGTTTYTSFKSHDDNYIYEATGYSDPAADGWYSTETITDTTGSGNSFTTTTTVYSNSSGFSDLPVPGSTPAGDDGDTDGETMAAGIGGAGGATPGFVGGSLSSSIGAGIDGATAGGGVGGLPSETDFESSSPRTMSNADGMGGFVIGSESPIEIASEPFGNETSDCSVSAQMAHSVR